ncbi:bA14K family protein (plasmid) [Rhizobium leguminosarum bv. viciae]|nr:bA14K family protein [Rhizobium leguminosarum bv. viciae]
MKAIASVAFGILSSVGACVAAASVASYVVADSEPHAFKELAARDLWTTTPVKVDPRQQPYERIPPLYSSYVTEASASMASAARPDSARPPAELQTPHPRLSAAHLAWCGERYRSFDHTVRGSLQVVSAGRQYVSTMGRTAA